MCVIPFIFNGVFGANVSFGGTSIVIIVGVILETVKRLSHSFSYVITKAF